MSLKLWDATIFPNATVTDLDGLFDSVIQVKLSWIQFLKRLSLTDLDQDSKNKHKTNHWSLLGSFVHSLIDIWTLLRATDTVTPGHQDNYDSWTLWGSEFRAVGLWRGTPCVPEQCVQFGCCTLRWWEDVSVLGHKTQPVLQETMKGIPKLLFLRRKYNISINAHVSY